MIALLFILFVGFPVDLRGLPPPSPALYAVEGYLDRAPEGVAVTDRVSLGDTQQMRSLLVVSYRRLGTGDPWALLRDRDVYVPDFRLMGAPDDVRRVLGGAAGTRVSGIFRHIRGDHLLIIQQLDAPR